MAKLRPICIYLDTSDYSRLSDERVLSRSETLVNVKSFLCSAVDEGRIVIRYSAVHIAEILHLENAHRALAVERSVLIKRLCGRHTFRAPMDLPAYEGAKRVLNRKRRLNPASLSVAEDDDGRWFPAVMPTSVDFVRNLQKKVPDGLKEANPLLSRKQRREIARGAQRGGMLSGRRLAEGAFQSADEMRKIFPLTGRFYTENLIGKLMLGEIGDDEFTDELMRGMTDPETFVGWYVDLYDQAKATAFWVRDMNQTMFSSVSEARRKFEELRESMEGAGMSEDARLKLAESAVRDMSTKSRARLLKAIYKVNDRVLGKLGVGWSDWQRDVTSSAHGEIPSLDFLLDIWPEYAKRIASRDRGSLKDSDGADMLHAMYLPYVDLFRADGAFGELLRPLARKRGYKVIGKLELLPNAILDLEADHVGQ